MNRIVNLKIKVYKYNFDCAIDCDFILHHRYEEDNKPTDTVEIEIWNLNEDWNAKIINYTNNTFHQINQHNNSICHTFIDSKFIIDEIKKWITENNKWYRIWYKLCHLFK